MKRPNAITASLAAAALLCLVAAAGGGAPRPRPAMAPAVAAPKAAVDTLFFDDFESDTLAWSTVDVLVQPPYWHIDSYNAYSGSSWWCGTYDPGFATNPGYGDAWVQYLHSPVLDLSAVVSDSVVLGFRQFYSVEGPSGGSDWDCVNLWASADSGATWSLLPPDQSRGTPAYNLTNATGWHYCGLAPQATHVAGWGGSSGGWQQAWFDLSAYKGGRVMLRFAVVSDGAESDQGSSYGGAWYIDEISVDTVSAGGAGGRIFYDDVEGGANGWAAGVKAPAIHWHRTTARAGSPVRSWYCGDSLTHLQSWGYSDALISPVIDLRDAKPTFPCVATFTQWVDLRDGNSGYIRGWDYYDVEASADSGRTWTALAQYDPAAPQSAWTAGPAVSLSPYVGGTVTLRVVMNTDEDDTCGEGVYLDDVIVTGKGKDPLPGPATVLLVDNDQEAVDLNEESWTKYFEASLAALGCRYSAAAIGANKPIYAGYLGQFPAVVWNLGARYQPMSEADLALLRAYLDGGGRLWLSGQYYLSTGPDTTVHPNLWSDYLHLSPGTGWYPSTAAVVTGVPGDPIGDGIAELLQYDRLNGGNQYWTDAGHAFALDPDTPAVGGLAGCFRNDDSTYCGLRYHDGTPAGYRLVYTSFPFEAVAAADSRDTLMARVLAWLLDGGADNTAPAAPAGFTAVQDVDSVVCRWSANNEPDLSGYRVYRSLQEGLPQWQLIGTVAAPDTTFTDASIEPARTYHYAVAAHDGAQPANESQWSPWVYLRTSTWARLGTEGGGVAGAPRQYQLGQCRPNPARGACRIDYGLPAAASVRLAVYNVTGQRVRTLVDRVMGAGYHSARWDGSSADGSPAAAGVYLYRLEAASSGSPVFSRTERMILVK